VEPSGFSDHNPLMMYTEYSAPGKQREFRFKLSWLMQSDFSHKVAAIWAGTTRDRLSLDKVQFKLKKVKKFLKGWGCNLAVTGRKRKQEILADLKIIELEEEEVMLEDEMIWKRKNLEAELFHILDEEELFWYKRSHETWLLKEGVTIHNFFIVWQMGKEGNKLFSL
jgi:hypothetical protein